MPEEIGSAIIRAVDPLTVCIVARSATDRIPNSLSLRLLGRRPGLTRQLNPCAARTKEFKDAIRVRSAQHPEA
jgi:hypothetical protein